GLGAPGGDGGWARSAVGRSTALRPKVGRAGSGTLSRRGGAETRRGAGVGTPAGPTFCPASTADPAPECGRRGAATRRVEAAPGGRGRRPRGGAERAGARGGGGVGGGGAG